jgi:molecular chaperone HscC
MIIGIDLGTTNSLVSIYKDGNAQLIPNALGEVITPSVVGFDERGTVLVGKAARERLSTHPTLTAANFKRYMGTEKTYHLGNQNLRPEELSSFVLRALKQDAEAHLGEEITEAVITVPAYFNDTQRKATQAAGEMAGLKVERLLNEPTAAALAYGLHQLDQEKDFLVFDLGGGTFDVSILELFDGVMEVRATAGDNFLGGEDFVAVIAEAFLKQMDEKVTLKNLSGEDTARLLRAAENTKRNLTNEAETTVNLLWKGKEHKLTLTRGAFEKACETLIKRLRTPLERALRDARIKPNALDEIVMVGGASRKPMVRQMVARLFGRFPKVNLNPDEVIALGAGVQAGLKARNEELKEVVLTDVCPYSLGVRTSQQVDERNALHNIFTPIIERNTVVPVSRQEEFMTSAPYQDGVNIEIYQGESRIVDQNIRLGLLKVKVPKKKELQPLEIRFTYDINGILEVEVTVVSTGKVSKLLIEENPGVLSSEQIQKRLKELQEIKIHPRDELANTTLLARGDHWYTQLQGHPREHLGFHLDRFRVALESQDPKVIKLQFDELSNLLDEFDNSQML